MNPIKSIQQRINPLRDYMSAADYRSALRLPAFQSGRAIVLGKPVTYSDGMGLLHSVEEIFQRQVYRFEATGDAPVIIDAGANIGLSVLYFKSLYPGARITAYEPDPDIFAMLDKNVGHLDGVELRRAAAWVENGELSFYSEGSLAGSTELDFAGKANVVSVPAERLRDQIAKAPVDFLKIDIEGAENSVLFDIEDALGNVRNLFFEYHSNPGKPQQLGDLLNLVSRAGFRYSINGARGPRLPFIQSVSHGFDLQLDVSCFRD